MTQLMTFQKWMEGRAATEDTPNYSFDQWVKSVEKLGSNVNSLINKAKEDEEESDKKIEKEKKDIEKSEPKELKKPNKQKKSEPKESEPKEMVKKQEKDKDHGRTEKKQVGKAVSRRLSGHKKVDSD